jgi:hypothetical protein
MERIVGPGRDFANLRICPCFGIAGERGELHALTLSEVDPLQIGKGHHERHLAFWLRHTLLSENGRYKAPPAMINSDTFI